MLDHEYGGDGFCGKEFVGWDTKQRSRGRREGWLENSDVSVTERGIRNDMQ